MRYADGGGLTAQGRSRREQVRLEAAEMFTRERTQADRGVAAGEHQVGVPVAARLAAGGEKALASRAWRERLQAERRPGDRLGAALNAGPRLRLEQDQRWTLARVAALVKRLFGVSYTRGACRTCCTVSGSPPGPGTPGAERDEDAIAAWRSRRGRRCEASGGDRGVDLLRGRVRAGTAAAEGPHLGPRAHPGGRVSGAGGGSRCRAGLPESRAASRLLPDAGPPAAPGTAGHVEADYAALITAAHRYLNARYRIWDNLNTT